MKKKIFVVLVIVIVFFGFYVWQNYKGALPAILKPSDDITKILPENGSGNISTNITNLPLKLPNGFSISIFAKDLKGARDMAIDRLGNVWVSQTSEGKISRLEVKNGVVVKSEEKFINLDKPHGLAFDGDILYFAEQTQISRVDTTKGEPRQIIAELPKGGRHFTRSLIFGSDDRLYVSIGSSCDVCREEDERLAAIFSMNKDGSDFKKTSDGLRNSVFMAKNSIDGKIWATEMGRDNLGDDLPPDEINIVEEGKNYGWPICYGNKIHDTNFDKNKYIKNPCDETVAAHIELPAHSAPLGLAFVPINSSWPKEYWGDLIVAFHGSWNRSEPTGYKLARIKLSANGESEGIDDFISGWLSGNGKTTLGRPVGLVFALDSSLYVSDDKAGVIYRVQPQGGDIAISEPSPNSLVTSPVEFSGQAKGTWFFEGSFPVKLLDEDGSVLSSGFASAKGDWMTENFVGFSGSLPFVKPKGKTGSLVFENDNPSGDISKHKEFKVPVVFK